METIEKSKKIYLDKNFIIMKTKQKGWNWIQLITNEQATVAKSSFLGFRLAYLHKT